MNDNTESSATLKMARSSRIQSLDFFRGLALIVILVDHVEMVTRQFVLSPFTLYFLGLSDGLDLFVFISGVVFGLVHTRAQEHGFIWSQWKAMRRMGVLLAANCSVFILVTILVLVLPVNGSALSTMRIHQAVAQPISAIWSVATMAFQPFGFDILPLYVVIVLIAPMILWVSNRTLVGGLAVSIGLYAMVLAVPAVRLVTADSNFWSYQPLGWQLVFTMGMLATRIKPKQYIHSFRILLAVSTLLAFLILSMFAADLTAYCYEWNATWLIGRSIPGPIRILHFSLLAATVSTILSFNKYGDRLKIIDPLSRVGKKPLPVFLIGLWFTYLVVFTFNQPTSLEIILIELNGILLSFIVAVIAQRWTATSDASELVARNVKK